MWALTGRDCVDQIFSLRILVEKAREFNSPLCFSFVDLCKAYDSVSRESVLKKRYNFPDKLINILQVLHHDTKGTVRAYGKLSKEFSINTGIRQGDVLAPVLLNQFLMPLLLPPYIVILNQASRCFTILEIL